MQSQSYGPSVSLYREWYIDNSYSVVAGGGVEVRLCEWSVKNGLG